MQCSKSEPCVPAITDLGTHAKTVNAKHEATPQRGPNRVSIVDVHAPGKQALLSVQPVLGFVENNRLRPVDDFGRPVSELVWSEEVAEIYLGPLIGSGIENWFPYMLALAFLFYRPFGLFGERTVQRV